MDHNCPVCGYDKLEEPPTDFEICPSCGTQFAVDDDLISHDDLRSRWISNGAHWWSVYNQPSQNWSPIDQLLRAGFMLTDDDLHSVADTELTTPDSIKLVSIIQPSDSGSSQRPRVDRVLLVTFPNTTKAINPAMSTAGTITNLVPAAQTHILEYA